MKSRRFFSLLLFGIIFFPVRELVAALEIKEVAILDSSVFRVVPERWETSSKPELQGASGRSFSEYVVKLRDDEDHLPIAELKSQIEKRLRKSRWAEFPSQAPDALVLEVEIAYSGLASPRIKISDDKSEIVLGNLPYFERLKYGLTNQNNAPIHILPGEDYFPGIAVFAELVTSDAETIRSHSHLISPSEERLRGYSQTAILKKPELLNSAWRKACIEMAVDLMETLKRSVRHMTPAVGAETARRDLPTETYTDGHFIWEQAPMVRPLRLSYPPLNEGSQPEGEVLLGVFVQTDGRVKSLEIVETGAEAGFVPAALSAMKHARFPPASHAGEPVEYVTWTRLAFSPPELMR